MATRQDCVFRVAKRGNESAFSEFGAWHWVFCFQFTLTFSGSVGVSFVLCHKQFLDGNCFFPNFNFCVTLFKDSVGFLVHNRFHQF